MNIYCIAESGKVVECLRHTSLTYLGKTAISRFTLRFTENVVP